jgi:bifunctional non-homologous end joining protein LigD
MVKVRISSVLTIRPVPKYGSSPNGSSSQSRNNLKGADSIYQPVLRTGLWSKHRVNFGQEFVIGGYVPGTHGFDSLVIGFYRGRDLYYAAPVRAGFVPATRREVFEQIKHLKTETCPFVNLPEKQAGRSGEGSRPTR